MWQMSDFEAAVFMLAVALMVALVTIVTWERSHRLAARRGQPNQVALV